MNDEHKSSEESIDALVRNPNRDKEKSFNQDDFIPEHQKRGLGAHQRAFMGDSPSPNQVLSSPPALAEEETMPYIDAYVHNKAREHKKETLKVGECVLMIDGKIILTGSMDSVLKEARSILYGENDQFDNAYVSIDDIIILKRMNLKVGVFLDE